MSDLLLSLAGREQGYSTEGDIVTRTADGRDINGLWNDYQALIAEQNNRRDGMVAFLTFPVTNIIEDVSQFGQVNFEEASEYGEPMGVRTALNYFSLGYSYKDYDLAKRFTWKFLRDASTQQVDAIHQMVLEADNRNVFNAVMKTVFNNVNLSTDINNQSYTVYKFYNNDGTKPPDYATNTFLSTHTHYLTSGAATLDSGDLEIMIENLRHHGYSFANGTEIVIMVNPAQSAVVRLFRQGQVNNNAAVAQYDFVPAVGQPALIVPNTTGLVGNQVSSSLRGMNVVGSYGPATIVEEDYVPAGYLFCFGTGGTGNLANPVGFRQHPDPAWRGLKLIPGNRSGYPLIDSFYTHGFGTGVRQRGGGVVMQVTASGTYAIPTIYV
jgi:hypothetical protein